MMLRNSPLCYELRTSSDLQQLIKVCIINQINKFLINNHDKRA